MMIQSSIPQPEPKLDDEKYTRKFKEEYLKNYRRMNWKLCYETGSKEGYFSKYKNFNALKLAILYKRSILSSLFMTHSGLFK